MCRVWKKEEEIPTADESAGMSPPNKAAGFFLNLWRDMAAGHYLPDERKELAEIVATSQRRDKARRPEGQNPRNALKDVGDFMPREITRLPDGKNPPSSRRLHAAGLSPPSRREEAAAPSGEPPRLHAAGMNPPT